MDESYVRNIVEAVHHAAALHQRDRARGASGTGGHNRGQAGRRGGSRGGPNRAGGSNRGRTEGGGVRGGRGQRRKWRSRKERQAINRAKTGISTVHDTPKPMFGDHQLIGDSILLRFARHIGVEDQDQSAGLSNLGLCIRGQTVGKLLERVKENLYPIGKKIILLIGCNDFLEGTKMDEVTKDLQQTVDLIGEQAEEIIIVTVPPIPRLECLPHHWLQLRVLNDFILNMGTTGQCSLQKVNVSHLFCENNHCNMEYFELFYSQSEKSDLIHLNAAGLNLLKEKIIEKIGKEVVLDSMMS